MTAALALALCLSSPPEPYPLGVWHGSAFGNKALGYVHLRHRVDRLPDGKFRYRYEATYKGEAKQVAVVWHAYRAALATMPGAGLPDAHDCEPRVPCVREFTSPHPPVYGVGSVWFFPLGGKRRAMAWQGGPVPAQK